MAHLAEHKLVVERTISGGWESRVHFPGGCRFSWHATREAAQQAAETQALELATQ